MPPRVVVSHALAHLPHLLPLDAYDRPARTPSLASPPPTLCAFSHSAIPICFPFTFPVSFCHRIHLHVFWHRTFLYSAIASYLSSASTCSFMFSFLFFDGICRHLCSSLLSYLASAFNAALALFHSLCSLVLACPGFSQRPAFRVRFHRRLTTSTRARRCDGATTARARTDNSCTQRIVV